MAKPAFDHCAAEYAQFRPGYPQAVFDLLAEESVPAGEHVAADIGAGTGIFARGLSASGWRVVAVEPSLAMLQQINGPAHRPIWCLRAAAEQLAMRDECVRLVTVAQAFHWFNPPQALAQFARILRPGGVLALVWNNRDADRSAFVAAYEELIPRYNPAYEREYRQQDWAGKIAACGAFEPAVYRHFEHEWRLPIEGFVGFSRSVSYIRNVLSRDQQPCFEADLRKLARQHFDSGECVIPLRTDLWVARRKPG